MKGPTQTCYQKKKDHSHFPLFSLLTLAWNLGTGIGFLTGLCMLRSITDWLISATASLVPLLGSPGELSWDWNLFIRSSRVLKLSDCGIFRIKGFCEEKRRSQVLHWGLTGSFFHWPTLEDNVLSILELFSYELGSSSIMALERSLVVCIVVLWLGLTGLSSDPWVNLSSKLVFFSKKCLLARLFTVKTSSLQEPRTFPSGYTDFDFSFFFL